MTLEYTIPGIPVTKKNSMQMAYNKKAQRWFPVPSKAYKAYEKAAKDSLVPVPETPINSPVSVVCLYYLPRNKDGSEPKKKPDLTNLLGATNDILVKYKILEDDNISIIRDHDGSRAFYGAKEPKTVIKIIFEEDKDGRKYDERRP